MIRLRNSHSTTDGVNWSPQSVIPGAASTDGRITLAWDGATLLDGDRRCSKMTTLRTVADEQ